MVKNEYSNTVGKLPKPPVLTQSEIELLRQDLKESMAYLINKAKKVYASHKTQEVKC